MPVNERVQEAPVGTLRAAFAGIGRFLKITDKIRSKPTAGEAPAEAKATATAQAAPKAAAPQAPEAGAIAEDTATVEAPEAVAAPESTVTTEDTATVETTTATEEATTAEAAEPTPAAAAEPAAEATAAAPAAELPLANYDTLTIASVRARLRNLSTAQLGQLVDYEKSHANRDDFIAAFERRIAKVQSES
ncbi:MAG TPA: hypothetical protein VK817_02900 [Trebonia sp.]|jgi:hypothetical protein|nr:hypothetical protein [Trebonia sp.]